MLCQLGALPIGCFANFKAPTISILGCRFDLPAGSQPSNLINIVAPAAAMVPGSNGKEGGPVAAAGVPALAGNGAVERKDAAPAAAAAAGGDSPKAVDMELD